MSPEDKIRIDLDAKTSACEAYDIPPREDESYIRGYNAGAEAEFNRREKLINEFERIIADGCSNCREFREEFAIALKKYKS